MLCVLFVGVEWQGFASGGGGLWGLVQRRRAGAIGQDHGRAKSIGPDDRLLHRLLLPRPPILRLQVR